MSRIWKMDKEEEHSEESNNSSADDTTSSSSSYSSSVPAQSSPPEPMIPSSGDDEAVSPYTLRELAAHGIERVGSSSEEGEKVKKLFIDGMGSMAAQTALISIHRNVAHPSDAFQTDTAMLERKHHGLSVYADTWLGGPKHQIFEIVQRGFFRHPHGTDSSPVYLSAIGYALDSVLRCDVDEGGVMHVMLCRATLGMMEEVKNDSTQKLPSSNEFDSGVDSRTYPSAFYIWAPFVNARVHPKYIVSFATYGLDDLRTRTMVSPVTQSEAFALLMQTLKKFLDSERMKLIVQSHNDFQERKMSRPQLIMRMRDVVGDHILRKAIMLNPLNPFK